MVRIFRPARPTARRRGTVSRPRFNVGLERLEPRQLLAVDVTTLADSGAGSLRAAIEAVNSGGKADTIVFKNLSAGTIYALSTLPTLAVSGTAFQFSGTTTAITLDGSGAGAGGDGLIIGSGVNTIGLSGIVLTIQNFAENGLSFAGGSTGTTVDGIALRLNGFNGIQFAGGNYSGTTVRNTQISDNGRAGIVTAAAATGLTIGGTLANQGNNIYGNGTHGIELAGGAYTGSAIVGNRIVDNDQCGIATAGGVSALTIGGTTATAANTIAINTASGIQLGPGSYAGTTIQGNTISLNEAAGITFAVAGGSATGLTIGGPAAGAGNEISGNGTAGLLVSAGTYTGTLVQGNSITGNTTAGVSLAPAAAGTVSGLTIGGTAAGTGNEIEANDAVGLLVGPGTYTSTLVQGNTIQSNGSHGVSLAPAAGTIAALTIGGSTAAANTITGNSGDGINVAPGTFTSTAVQANTISSNAGAGLRLAPGGGSLVGLAVGGTTKTPLGNTLVGNTAGGVVAEAGTYTGTLVQGNQISGSAVGVSLTGAQEITIGGGTSDLGNTVTGSTTQGLFATGTLTKAAASFNVLTNNVTGAELQDATGFTFGNTGVGNRITGGSRGIVARGTLDNSQVLGNTVSGAGTGILLVDARGSASTAPFRVGTTTTAAGTGVGNNVTATTLGLHARGDLTNTFVAGNLFRATAAGGNGAALVNAVALTLGGFNAGDGNILTAGLGNGLYATGLCSGTRVYRNNITASQYGIVLDSARNLFVGFLYNPAVGNLVQYNQVGLFTNGVNTGTGVTYTNWFRNVRRQINGGNVFIFPA
jgi:hypothetical protein